MNKIEIQNVVATASLGTTMNLLEILKAFKTSEYNPKRFPGLVFRLKRPKTATLIFSTGKLVCTGAKSSKLARRAVKKVVKELRGEGFKVADKPKVTVQNIVASADLSSKIDLEGVLDCLDHVMYEPSEFPGVIYRMKDPKVVILIFASGKLVITGAKTEEQVNLAADKVRAELTDYELLY